MLSFQIEMWMPWEVIYAQIKCTFCSALNILFSHTFLTYCTSAWVCAHMPACACVCVHDFVGCMYWHRLGSNWFLNMVTALFKKGSSQSEWNPVWSKGKTSSHLKIAKQFPCRFLFIFKHCYSVCSNCFDCSPFLGGHFITADFSRPPCSLWTETPAPKGSLDCGEISQQDWGQNELRRETVRELVRSGWYQTARGKLICTCLAVARDP